MTAPNRLRRPTASNEAVEARHEFGPKSIEVGRFILACRAQGVSPTGIMERVNEEFGYLTFHTFWGAYAFADCAQAGTLTIQSCPESQAVSPERVSPDRLKQDPRRSRRRR